MNKAEQIRELRRSGQSLKQIAQIVGCDKAYCSQVCRAAGLGGAIIEQRLTESQVADYVSRSGFTYVGGYTMAKAPITVRCRKCGGTFERQFHIFRDVVNGTWSSQNECPLCRQDRQEEERIKRQEERSKQKEHDAQEREWQRAERHSRAVDEELAKRLAIHVCKNCGKEYCQMITGYNSKTYCSEKCQERWYSRRASEKRYKKLMSRRHDTDISLELLYKKEHGVCYLCGSVCDWSDGEERDGTFVAGGNYPSIDHVVPVAKGGTHTWDNIRLACRRCNIVKRDRIAPPSVPN